MAPGPHGRTRSPPAPESEPDSAGAVVLRFATADLYRFLARTYTVVAPGEETVGAELGQGLVALFGGRV